MCIHVTRGNASRDYYLNTCYDFRSMLFSCLQNSRVAIFRCTLRGTAVTFPVSVRYNTDFV